MLETFQQVK